MINLIQSLFFSILESGTINLFGASNKVSFRTKTTIMNRVCLQCISSNYFTNTFYHIMCWIRLRMHHRNNFCLEMGSTPKLLPPPPPPRASPLTGLLKDSVLVSSVICLCYFYHNRGEYLFVPITQ